MINSLILVKSGSLQSRVRGDFPSLAKRGSYLNVVKYPHSTASFSVAIELTKPPLIPWLIHGA